MNSSCGRVHIVRRVAETFSPNDKYLLWSFTMWLKCGWTFCCCCCLFLNFQFICIGFSSILFYCMKKFAVGNMFTILTVIWVRWQIVNSVFGVQRVLEDEEIFIHIHIILTWMEFAFVFSFLSISSTFAVGNK